jgi:hypothetical protein
LTTNDTHQPFALSGRSEKREYSAPDFGLPSFFFSDAGRPDLLQHPFGRAD